MDSTQAPIPGKAEEREVADTQDMEPKRLFFVGYGGYPHGSVSTLNMGVLLTTHLLGRILTLIDASVTDQRQNKAVKDMVKQMMWDAFNDIRMWMIENSARNPNAPYTPFPFSDNRSID